MQITRETLQALTADEKIVAVVDGVRYEISRDENPEFSAQFVWREFVDGELDDEMKMIEGSAVLSARDIQGAEWFVESAQVEEVIVTEESAPVTLESIAAQISEDVAFEAPYTDEGRYTAFVTLHGDGFNDTCYRVAYMRGVEFTHDEYFFTVEQLTAEMSELNADPAAWQRWEYVNREWEMPAQAAEVQEVQPEAAPAIDWERVAKTLYWRSDDIAGTDFILRNILGLDPDVMLDKK